MSQWFVEETPRSEAALDLFCFPPAGGSSALYRAWGQGLGPELRVLALELPGREARFSETAFTNMDALLDELLPELLRQRTPGRPFAFFGHSMGASIAFELTRRMRAEYHELPLALLLSARKAPQRPERFPFLHDLSDADFIEGLRAYGGTPEAVLADEELMNDVVVPLLRADFTLFETKAYQPAVPLPVPFFVFGGAEDPRAIRDELQAWRVHAGDDFQLRILPGGHFYLREHEAETLAAVGAALDSVLG